MHSSRYLPKAVYEALREVACSFNMPNLYEQVALH